MVMSKLEDGAAAASPDHGVNTLVLVARPHVGGVLNSDRSPPKKCSSSELICSCGSSRKTIVNWPVFWLASISPASLTETPDIGSSATTYTATGEADGFSFGAAR